MNDHSSSNNNNNNDDDDDAQLKVPFLRCYAGIQPEKRRNGLFGSTPDSNQGTLINTLRPENGTKIDWNSYLQVKSRAKDAFCAISYKHQAQFYNVAQQEQYNNIRIHQPRKNNAHAMFTSPRYMQEVGTNLQRLGFESFWHDGVPFSSSSSSSIYNYHHDANNNNRFRSQEGLYPYLLDQATVLVCLPSPTEGVMDPGEWCPDRYPLARNALLEAVNFIEWGDGSQPLGGIFTTRLKSSRSAALPSLAWGSFNSVWLLAESFCGCLTSRIKLTSRSLEAARSFIGEIKFAQRLIAAYRRHRRGESTATRLAWQKMNPPGYWSETRCSRAIQELECLANEVRDYLRLVLKLAPRPSAFELSRVFVEKMLQASYAIKTDQIMLGAFCSYLLQRVAGQGWSPSHALRDIRSQPDPLCFCFQVASSGQYGFGRGISFAQQIASLQRHKLRDPDHVLDKNLFELGDLWPQPVYGPAFAGSATGSEWKEIFWLSIHGRQCLGWEDVEEENALRTKLLKEIVFPRQQERVSKAMYYLDSRGSIWRNQTGAYADVALEHLEKSKCSYRGFNAAVRNLDTDDYRSDWIKLLRQSWHKAQSCFRFVVGSECPVALDKASKVIVLYMLDTSALGGHPLDTMTGGDFVNISLVQETENDSPGFLHKEVHLGDSFDISLEHHPLYQMAFSFGDNKTVRLVLHRRIWARKSRHVPVPLSLENLKSLSKAEIQPGSAGIDNRSGSEGVSRIADYSTTYPTILRSSCSVTKHPEVLEMKKLITSVQWTETSFRRGHAANHTTPSKKATTSKKATKKKSPPRPKSSVGEEKKEDPLHAEYDGEEKKDDESSHHDSVTVAVSNNRRRSPGVVNKHPNERIVVRRRQQQHQQQERDTTIDTSNSSSPFQVVPGEENASVDEMARAVRAYCSRGLENAQDDSPNGDGAAATPPIRRHKSDELQKAAEAFRQGKAEVSRRMRRTQSDRSCKSPSTSQQQQQQKQQHTIVNNIPENDENDSPTVDVDASDSSTAASTLVQSSEGDYDDDIIDDDDDEAYQVLIDEDESEATDYYGSSSPLMKNRPKTSLVSLVAASHFGDKMVEV